MLSDAFVTADTQWLLVVIIGVAIGLGCIFKNTSKYIFYIIALVFLTPLFLLLTVLNFVLKLKGKEQITMPILPWSSESAEKADESDSHPTSQQNPVIRLVQKMNAKNKQKNK